MTAEDERGRKLRPPLHKRGNCFPVTCILYVHTSVPSYARRHRTSLLYSPQSGKSAYWSHLTNLERSATSSVLLVTQQR
jgi:hypothetical protein